MTGRTTKITIENEEYRYIVFNTYALTGEYSTKDRPEFWEEYFKMAKSTKIAFSYKGFLVCIDHAKAFDNVNHDYLFKTLEVFGLHGNFLKVTKTLYQNITSQVTINGSPTNKIPIKRGVRQGCPYSMLLFVLCSIPLIEMINDDGRITGHVTRRRNTIKIQAADDNTVIIKNSNELDHIIHHNL